MAASSLKDIFAAIWAVPYSGICRFRYRPSFPVPADRSIELHRLAKLSC